MTPDQAAQVAECLRILRLGHTAGWLRSLGYAEGAIQAALRQAEEDGND